MIAAETSGHAIREAARLLVTSGTWTDAIDEPTSVGSRFGSEPRRTLERLGVSIHIATPEIRACQNGARTWSWGFALANYLWALRATRNASDILPYNDKGAGFVSEGNFEASLGHRMASAYGDPVALQSVVRLLIDHPTTRRAVVPFLLPNDMTLQPPDFPCAVATHFILRQGRLHCMTTMRSQSLVGLLGYDLWLFTLLQSTIAFELGVPLGKHVYCIGSLHSYENESAALNDIAEGSVVEMPFMNLMKSSPLSDPRILESEEQLRRAVLSGSSPWPEMPMVSPEWVTVLALLERKLTRESPDLAVLNDIIAENDLTSTPV